MRHVTQCPDIVKEILVKTTDLRSRGCRVVLVWIPAHDNITGNDIADKLANARRPGTNNIEVSLSTEEMQSITRKIINREKEKIEKSDRKNSEKARIAHRVLREPCRNSQIKDEIKIPPYKILWRLIFGTRIVLFKEPYCDE
jgi:hypothetical protein